jgi:hypothetical protein
MCRGELRTIYLELVNDPTYWILMLLSVTDDERWQKGDCTNVASAVVAIIGAGR